MEGFVKLVVAVSLYACVLAAAGCGGDEAAVRSDAGGAIQPRLYPSLEGPTREFLIRGGDNVVQTFGREATKDEREQVSRVIEGWMKARAAQDWARDCTYFSRAYVHSLVATDARQVTNGRVKTCPQALAYFGHQASGSYKNNLTGPIDSLRVSEGQGYVQYHGNDGHDWIIPVESEDGKWLVAIAAPIGRSS